MRLALRPDNRRWHHVLHALMNCADGNLLRVPSLGPQQLREDLLAAAAGQSDAVSAICANFLLVCHILRACGALMTPICQTLYVPARDPATYASRTWWWWFAFRFG